MPDIKLTDFDTSKCPDFTPNNNFHACFYYDPADNPAEMGYCKQSIKYFRCLADVKVRSLPLSHSSVQDFLTCHHLFYLKKLRGIEIKNAATSSPIKCGKLWDTVKQVHLGEGNVQTIKNVINSYEILDKDIAKVKGIYRAYEKLEINVDPDFELQAPINQFLDFDGSLWAGKVPVKLLITGFYDRKYPNHFTEDKFTSRPDNYLDPFFIQSQVATYFLADPNLQSVTMEIVRSPDLKSTGKNKEEDPVTYGERVFQDVISRPSHYFIGYDRDTNRYGKKFFRSEFDLESVQSRFVHILREIYGAMIFDGWYKSDKSCGAVLPGIPCDMKPICRYNNMSESIYQ